MKLRRKSDSRGETGRITKIILRFVELGITIAIQNTKASKQVYLREQFPAGLSLTFISTT